jgi:hypothetical protein
LSAESGKAKIAKLGLAWLGLAWLGLAKSLRGDDENCNRSSLISSLLFKRILCFYSLFNNYFSNFL